MLWRGRLRGGGGERELPGKWVRTNFRASFLRTVISKHGTFVHVPIGRAQEQPQLAVYADHWDGPEVLAAPSTPEGVNSTVACPVVAYQQGGADLCAAYGLASAVRFFGDHAAADAIAACAEAALASGDAFGHVRKAVHSDAAGWSEAPLHNHNPLLAHISQPVLLQLVGSDGAGTHAVATAGDLIFDSTEAFALPLTRASLDRCVGTHLNGVTFSHVARAIQLQPGKSVRKWLQKQAQHSARRSALVDRKF